MTEVELQQAKAKVCANIVLRSERPASRMFTVGGAWIQRRAYLTVKQTVERYRAVTVAEVNDVLRKYPLSKNMTVAVGPLQSLGT